MAARPPRTRHFLGSRQTGSGVPRRCVKRPRVGRQRSAARLQSTSRDVAFRPKPGSTAELPAARALPLARHPTQNATPNYPKGRALGFLGGQKPLFPSIIPGPTTRSGTGGCPGRVSIDTPSSAASNRPGHASGLRACCPCPRVARALGPDADGGRCDDQHRLSMVPARFCSNRSTEGVATRDQPQWLIPQPRAVSPAGPIRRLRRAPLCVYR
jgi:hypothetical protein